MNNHFWQKSQVSTGNPQRNCTATGDYTGITHHFSNMKVQDYPPNTSYGMPSSSSSLRRNPETYGTPRFNRALPRKPRKARESKSAVTVSEPITTTTLVVKARTEKLTNEPLYTVGPVVGTTPVNSVYSQNLDFYHTLFYMNGFM